MSAKHIAKRIAQGISLGVAWPAAVVCGFGRIPVLYTFCAQVFAIGPGIVGDFLRVAFYRYTLEECSMDTRIGFGSFFSRRAASVAPGVAIGAFCVIGCARIGPRTQISSHVEIPSGRYEHARGSNGHLVSSGEGKVEIGADCWIGAGAIIMANVGDRSTIGAGSVVIRDIPAGVVAVGVPAKPIKPTS